MLPPKSAPQWQQLVCGELNHPFKAFVGAMCVTRIVRFVKKEGGTPEAIAMGIDDLYTFFSKLDIALADDIKVIFGQEVDHAEHGR